MWSKKSLFILFQTLFLKYQLNEYFKKKIHRNFGNKTVKLSRMWGKYLRMFYYQKILKYFLDTKKIMSKIWNWYIIRFGWLKNIKSINNINWSGKLIVKILKSIDIFYMFVSLAIISGMDFLLHIVDIQMNSY